MLGDSVSQKNFYQFVNISLKKLYTKTEATKNNNAMTKNILSILSNLWNLSAENVSRIIQIGTPIQIE